MMSLRTVLALALSLVFLPALALVPPPPRLPVAGYILYETNSDKVIAEFEADRRLPIASLTKIMTAYIVVDQAAKEDLDMTAEIPVSRYAADAIGSQTFLRAGSRVAILDLLKGIAIQSGNDAARVLAEHIGGSEDGFTDLMNAYADGLGMKNTLYANSTGLPSDREQYSTARDQAKLTHHLIRNYPDHYKLYKEKSFTYNDIRQPNRNRLLWLDPSVDGVKTGHTEEAGYCLVSSAERSSSVENTNRPGDRQNSSERTSMRLIAVVMGTATESERNTYSRRLLEYGFRHYATKNLLEKNSSLQQARVWGGLKESVNLGISENLQITLPRADFEEVQTEIFLDDDILAPVEAGTRVGEVQVRVKDELIATRPLVTLERIRPRSFPSRIWARIRLLFSNLFGGD